MVRVWGSLESGGHSKSLNLWPDSSQRRLTYLPNSERGEYACLPYLGCEQHLSENG
jgi:hypothetical protein